ncbi:hypothetical protein QFC19_002465 [Naganishia cerealis]|uniref:Uncharacterized protein n=1 Tax=Naganishia cerealis TaxID=610337 RepID=A0ACC2W907_9TREE|nr:hypothetical protein QFC19_002465 [Naganishia cerealis]
MTSPLSSLVDSLTAGESATSESVFASVTASTTEWISSTITASASASASSALMDSDLGGLGGGVGISEGSPVGNFFLGMTIVLGASVMNAFGLNLTKLDHMRAQALPKHSRPKDWQRPLWLLGMLAYIASQIFGSTLSLKYLRSDWVAPLGSTSLVFNFLFAKLLVGIEVTREDVRGTALIVLGVLCILIFSSINHGLDGVITVERLSQMWSRGNWLAWFFFITFSTLLTYEFTHLLALLLKSRESLSPDPAMDDHELSLASTGGGRRKPSAWGYASNPLVKALYTIIGAHRKVRGNLLARLERMLERTDDARIKYIQGIGWAVVGGSLAAPYFRLLSDSFPTDLPPPSLFPFVHPTLHRPILKQFAHFASLVTVLFVALTAILQIICLNKGLKTADSTLVVPLFYAGYTVLGFVNSLIFMNETTQYETWVLVTIFLSIGVLVAGVVLLSLKKTEADPAGGHTVSASHPSTSMRLNPTMHQARTSARPPLTTSASGSREPGSARARANSRLSATAGQTGGVSPIAGGEQVVWEVGSVSDDSDDEGKGRGVGGVPDGYGERGGLLFDREEDDEEVAAPRPLAASPDADRIEGYRGGKSPLANASKDRKGEDEEDPFGDFEDGKR